jgi:hypothetical protein
MSFPEAVTRNWLAGVTRDKWVNMCGRLVSGRRKLGRGQCHDFFVTLDAIFSPTWFAILSEVN